MSTCIVSRHHPTVQLGRETQTHSTTSSSRSSKRPRSIHARKRCQEACVSDDGPLDLSSGPERKRSRSNEIPMVLPSYAATISTDYSVDVAKNESLMTAADMLADFFDELSMLYSLVSDFKTSTSEAQSIDLLLDRIAFRLEDENCFPTCSEEAQKHSTQIQDIYKGLCRVYVHIFQMYYRRFVELDASQHITTCCHRLFSFVAEFQLVETPFLSQVQTLIMRCIAMYA